MTEFFVDRRSKDGLQGRCKECHRAVVQRLKDRDVASIVQRARENGLMKTCTKCGQKKPVTGFFAHGASADGFRPDCKVCSSVVVRAHYERAKPKIMEQQRDYASRNAYAIRQMHQEAHRRRSQDPEWLNRQRAKAREYGRTHPAQRSERQWRRLQRIATATVRDFTGVQWEALKAAYGNRCAYCGISSLKLQTDHVIPLVHGGPHTARNIVPSCGLCNSRKGTGPALPYRIIPTAFVA